MTPSSSTYDYIIVGAGSAGCALARRLSDDPSTRVLLLEAGPVASGFWVRTPAGMAKLFKNERLNWRYYTEPVPALNQRKLYWPRGKGLGGTSAINGMVYLRGNRRDYDHWQALGNPGWGWDDVLPIFRAMENNSRGASEVHGVDGPMAVEDVAVRHPSAVDFVEAARQAGHAYLEDLNTGELEGAGHVQSNIRRGRRHSSYDAYLAPVRGRANLTVLTGVHVRRVLLQGSEATGVELVQGGSTQVFQAAREVVLSAGALSSPHLLMLSGIGDAAALQQHGIAPVQHLPGVGKNLQDHFSVRMQMGTDAASSFNSSLLGWRKYLEGARYLLSNGGYLALPSSVAAAFVRSGPSVDYADLEISFRPMTFTHHENGNAEVDPYHAISASVYRVRPASRGEVRLRSADPLQAPAFEPNYLGDPQDVEAMVSGMRQLRQIFAAQPIARRITEELVPGPQVQTDEQWIDFMREHGHCAFHPAGSCKMGTDAMAVVDERLRVRGIQRLRVVDASIMPVVTSCNTNAPSIMIGEKGAQMIAADQLARRAVS